MELFNDVTLLAGDLAELAARLALAPNKLASSAFLSRFLSGIKLIDIQLLSFPALKHCCFANLINF